MTTAIIVIALRLVHVTCSLFWLGVLTIYRFFIMPLVPRTAPYGTRFVNTVNQSSLIMPFLHWTSNLTVASGLLLLLHAAWISRGAVLLSGSGIVYVVAVVATLLAVHFGRRVSARSAEQLGEIRRQLEQSGAPATPEQNARIAVLRTRIRDGAFKAYVLLVFTITTMAVARYL